MQDALDIMTMALKKRMRIILVGKKKREKKVKVVMNMFYESALK